MMIRFVYITLRVIVECHIEYNNDNVISSEDHQQPRILYDYMQANCLPFTTHSTAVGKGFIETNCTNSQTNLLWMTILFEVL